MKRILLLIAVVALAIPTFGQQYYGQVVDPDGYTNIRKGPGTNYAITNHYESGDFLYYTPLKNGWSKVYSANKASSFMGYMATDRILRVNPTKSTSTANEVTYKGVITDPKDTYVNVRKGPGNNYAIATRLNIGTVVRYAKSTASWYKVYLGGKCLGYVHKSRIISY